MSRLQPFGPYDLLERVSVGGMAEIFRARVRATGEIVAIKRILPEVEADAEFIEMFVDEGRIAAQLEHPNIVKVFDIGAVDETHYLAMQFVEGLDLRAVFDRAAARDVRLDFGWLATVLIDVCAGLSYAHERKDAKGRPLNLVHRDVSPQNILVGFDGSVKIIDFGIAKAAGKLSKTQVGTIKGKYAYMSPEQVRGLPVDARSDLFSLGICMWELATRKRLFSAENELLIMERIRYAEIAPPRKVDPDVPPAFEKIILKALAKDVGERYPSAAELSVALQSFLRQADQTWDRARVAEYTRRTFSGNTAKAQGIGESVASREALFGGDPARSQEAGRPPAIDRSFAQEQSMSDNKGSDLDVFEGLSSKRADTRRPSVAPPPPPPSRSVPAPPGAPPRRAPTMVGLGVAPVPPPPPPTRSGPPMAPPPSRNPAAAPPPPPPGSARLQVSPPGAAAAPPPPPPPPAPAVAAPAPGRGATVDMDWDDEDEKTHIYDNAQMPAGLRSSSNAVPANSAPPPAAGAPLPPPGAPRGPGLKGTMVGMSAPLPPPPSRSDRPLPPPSRAPGLPPPAAGALPPPPAAPLPPPPSAPNPLARTALASGPPLPPPPASGRSNPPPRAPTPAPFPAQAVPMMPAPAPAPVSPMASAPVDAFLAAPAAPVVPPQPMRPVADGTQVIQAKKSSGPTIIIVAAVLLAIVAGGGAFLFMQSRPGNVVVNVDVKGGKDNGILVSIDGAEKCKDSACRIEGVSSGTHVVKAAIGDVEAKASVSVEPGKDAIVNLKLEVAPKKSGLKVSSKQSGVKVDVDGQGSKELPLSLDDLKPGKHTLKFTGEKYKSKETEISIDEGQTKTVDDVKLALKSVSTKFTFVTKGAKASITDGSKNIDLADDGKAIDLDTSKSWVLKATAPNFDDLTRPIEFSDDPEQNVKIELNEKGKVAVAPPVTPPAGGGTPPAGGVKTPPAGGGTPPATGGGGDGTLFINTLPGSNCVVNGTPRGHTPMTLSVPPGSYNVTCVAKDGEDTLKKSGSATVESGKKANVILKLRD